MFVGWRARRALAGGRRFGVGLDAVLGDVQSRPCSSSASLTRMPIVNVRPNPKIHRPESLGGAADSG